MKLILTIITAVLILSPTLSGAEEHRSEAAKDHFKKIHPCPANGNDSGPCPGYVIDHITPLACGGADNPVNMQWQTEEEGKLKDKWERDGCEQKQHSHTQSRPEINGNDQYYVGKRGGCYKLSVNGNKQYVDRSNCGN
jgi:hypothetical protein